MNNSTDLTTPFLEFANLACLPGPRWATRSDYNACVPLQLSEEGEQVVDQEDKHHHHHHHHHHHYHHHHGRYSQVWEVSYSSSLAHIYFSGYSISLAALTTALLIFAYFKLVLIDHTNMIYHPTPIHQHAHKLQVTLECNFTNLMTWGEVSELVATLKSNKQRRQN